jgi:hypothetical protein
VAVVLRVIGYIERVFKGLARSEPGRPFFAF